MSLREGWAPLQRGERQWKVRAWPLVLTGNIPVALKGPCLFPHSPATGSCLCQIPNISGSWDMNQPKLFRAAWPVRAQLSVAPEETCRILLSVGRGKSGAAMPEPLYTQGVDLVIKDIKIIKFYNFKWSCLSPDMKEVQSGSSECVTELILTLEAAQLGNASGSKGAALILWGDSKSISAKGTEQSPLEK